MTTMMQHQESALKCAMLTDEEILELPVDQRDVHTNKARLAERQLQEKSYRLVRDVLGIPYGIEHNPLMPPIMEQPEITLFGGRRGVGKSNELGWWASYWKMRGYDPLTNMSLLNSYMLEDMTDIYTLGYLWTNTPTLIDEMQMVAGTFEGPAHKTRLLLDFYSQIRKLNSRSTWQAHNRTGYTTKSTRSSPGMRNR